MPGTANATRLGCENGDNLRAIDFEPVSLRVDKPEAWPAKTLLYQLMESLLCKHAS
jgi:hypothetical protein